jgi:SAM-dependent methyltransferase
MEEMGEMRAMDELSLLTDLHKRAYRQGPGGDEETRLAFELARIDKATPLRVADIGCGTGAPTLCLARELNAAITAVDFLDTFLEVLEERASSAGLSDKISTFSGSMENLPFDEGELDLIWSEGAIYNIGFENGVRQWRHFLKPGGLLVVSEITWITETRPAELQRHWESEYPEVDLASNKLAALERSGYSPAGYFFLPENCWIDNYYRPMEAGFADFLERNGNDERARTIVEAEKREIDLYREYKDYYSYGVYISRKTG